MNEANPIAQRCITISKEHRFEHFIEMGFYMDKDGNKIKQEQWVFRDGKNIYKCLYCGLVDDLYEGRYK